MLHELYITDAHSIANELLFGKQPERREVYGELVKKGPLRVPC